jgi:putative PIN family toxin of toxin-antitoxin system
VISVTLDTNKYISALIKDGPPRQLLNFANQGQFRLDVSEEILSELTGVLMRKFEWTREECAFAREQILSVANLVTVSELLNDVPDDKDDNRILECSYAAGSDYLVTGDNHLLKLRAHRRIRIIDQRSCWRSCRQLRLSQSVLRASGVRTNGEEHSKHRTAAALQSAIKTVVGANLHLPVNSTCQSNDATVVSVR